jgi:hypothetical protein
VGAPNGCDRVQHWIGWKVYIHFDLINNYRLEAGIARRLNYQCNQTPVIYLERVGDAHL